MRAQLEFDFDSEEWLVIKIIYLLTFIFASTCTVQTAFSSEKLPDVISAESIRPGCSIYFVKRFYSDSDDPLSVPPYDLVSTWKCQGVGQSRIDTYEINGGSPEVVTVTYWKRRAIVVLVKWSINSRASDYVGDYYKVYVYKRMKEATGKERFVRDEAIMNKFPEGWGGNTQSGTAVRYPFKDAASIKRRLVEIHYDDRMGR
jgi:hypothetical protein